MAFQRVPLTAQIKVVYRGGDQDIVNLYYAKAPAGYGQADLDNLAHQIATNAMPGLKADQSAHLTYMRTEVQGLDQENDLSSVTTLPPNPPGQGGVALPWFVTFCVSQLSGLSGRSARGRVYVSGLPPDARDTGSGDQNLITQAFADAYVLHIDAFRQVIESITEFDAVLVSRYHNGSKRAEAVTFPWVTTAYSTLKFSTRRSRR